MSWRYTRLVRGESLGWMIAAVALGRGEPTADALSETRCSRASPPMDSTTFTLVPLVLAIAGLAAHPSACGESHAPPTRRLYAGGVSRRSTSRARNSANLIWQLRTLYI